MQGGATLLVVAESPICKVVAVALNEPPAVAEDSSTQPSLPATDRTVSVGDGGGQLIRKRTRAKS
jgi:hypothetical protein